jgi:peptidoglycan/xylan/chitin deacetylase (PgdA/CDA1 family)
LTFDDGPGNRLTPAILKLLAENDIKATFFLLGKNIAGRERIVRQIAEQGHEICSHGYDHLHYRKVSFLRALADIKRGWQAIDTALGARRRIYPFRPPYGKLNIVCLLYLLIRRIPIVFWTLDSGDTRPRSERRSRGITFLTRKASGAVSLAHDFDRADDSIDQLILESLRSAIAMTRQRGMRTLTVSQFLNQRT